MPANEYSAWAGFYQLFPFGDVRGDMQAGIVASVVANANRSKSSKPFTPADFMPNFNKVEKSADDAIVEKIDKFMRVYH